MKPSPEPSVLTLHPIAAGAGALQEHVDGTLALLRSVLDAVPARAVVLDAQERLAYANPEFFAFTKLRPEQVLGLSIQRVIGPVAYASYAPITARLRLGESVSWEGWVELAGQGRRYMREHLVPHFGPEGPRVDHNPRATVVMSLDITELKLRDAELTAKVHELETTQALKSAIVDHAQTALITTDESGVIVEFNPAAENTFGWQRDQVIGRRVAELIVPERFREGHTQGMARIAKGEPARLLGKRIEMPALHARGHELPVEMVLWRTEAAGTVFYTASMSDMTQRHNAAQEIERQREALRQSEKLTAMGSLLAGVAHELNNPLAIVMGRASLLEDKAAGTPMAQDAQRIRDAAERCGRIVRTFLNMARSRPSEKRAVQLNEMVGAAVDMLQYGLRSHGIELQLQLSPALPEVMADADQLGQIVLNLMVNAQQALSSIDGVRRLHLASGVHQGADGAMPLVWLRVADSGAGVPAHMAAKIFDPFFTTKSEGMGTGLGLAVSRSIARDHGGELVLEDGPGGASFLLRLPISGVASPEPVMPPAPLPEPARAARLLVVDDEEEIAALMRDFLERAGYEVMTAESGAVALELLDTARFDAIVSDLRMRDLDGAALWREVRQRQPQLAARMLFVTGDTLSPEAQRFLGDSGCASLDKPFGKAELLARVRELLV